MQATLYFQRMILLKNLKKKTKKLSKQVKVSVCEFRWIKSCSDSLYHQDKLIRFRRREKWTILAHPWTVSSWHHCKRIRESALWNLWFDILGPKPLMGYNHAFSQGELSTSQKQAVVTLIEKKGRDKRYIKNWRPISLLNVDAKIISKILATRLKKVISQLISSDQTAYVPGRFIGESVRLTSDVLEYMKTSELPGYLITIGTEKAFDSVDHTFLVAVLKKFGFGDDFIRWVRIILNRQESCIMNNGHSTGYFPLSSGTRQGDPISAYLFILVMEIFFIQVRTNPDIKGLTLFGYELKITSFADDVSYFLQDLKSIKELLRLLKYSEQFTSLKVSHEKSEICGIGSKKGVMGAFSSITSVDIVNDIVKVLGCHQL